MNEIFFSAHARAEFNRSTIRRIIWNAASSLALGGLYTWKMDDHWVSIERRRMHLRGLGKAFRGCKLAHISDLHLSPIVREKYLMKFVDVINSLDVDFIALTGDLLTGLQRRARRVGRIVSHFKPNVATLACLGNHDYGVWRPGRLRNMKLADCLCHALQDAGVHVMNNESHAFRRHGEVLQFVGLEDLWTGRYDAQAAFRKIHADRPTVALCHNPDCAHELAQLGAQWVLAGHTHGKDTRSGKLRETFVPSAFPHYVAGQYHLGEDNHLYINRGIGYSRRQGHEHRPEITLFTLE